MDATGLHEKNRYEDPNFPFGVYRADCHGIIPEGRGYRDVHWHEELQFTLAAEGRVVMQAGGKDHVLSKGDAIFINGGVLHATTDIFENGRYISFNFPEKILSFFPGSSMERECVHPYTGNSGFLYHVFRAGTGVPEILRELDKMTESGLDAVSKYAVAAELTELWLEVIKTVPVNEVTAGKTQIRRQERVRNVIAFIREHYSEDITLENMASSAGVSQGECNRCFREELHTTPVAYLTSYRINRAMELLRETSMTVTEVASAAGFNHTSYFIEKFKAVCNMTPGEYRAKNAEGRK